MFRFSLIAIFVLFAGMFALAATPKEEKLDEYPSIQGGMSALIPHIKYPDAARKEGVTGKVFISLRVDIDGAVDSIKVVKSARADLDEAALAAIRAVKWVPAKKNGKPVATFVTIPIDFKLDCKKKSE